MKKVLLLACIIIAFSCKKETTKAAENKFSIAGAPNAFPIELGKVFKKHGSLNAWKEAQTLSFNKGEEVHIADLRSRKTVVTAPNYSMGFDGRIVWLDELEKGMYKGNPAFYYNLYFYFYAMPFVLADNGIKYEKVSDLSFEGVQYPGYKISYKGNIGSSPDDNYIVYHHPETFQMEWLKYTVTFNSKEVNTEYHLIKYDVWENTGGLVLPSEIIWYQMDARGMPSEAARAPVKFTFPLISKAKLANSFFEKPVGVQK
jgi:hypothetical protein